MLPTPEVTSPEVTSPEVTSPEPPRVPRAPSTRVLGIEGHVPPYTDGGLELGTSALVVPARGGDPGVLVLGSTGGDPPFEDLPQTFVIPGVLPAGDHDVRDVTIGGFVDVYTLEGTASVAGDPNGDGHTDLWLTGNLFHGPFDRFQARADAVATLAPIAPYATLGGVDVDGDGADDVIVDTGRYVGFVFFGPLAGSIPILGEPGFDADRAAIFQSGSLGLAWLPDPDGPGTLAFAAGRGGYDYEGTYVYHLPMEPGARADHPPAAIYGGGADWTSFMPVRGVGDLDGDGFGDALVGEGHGSVRVLLGPFDDVVGWWEENRTIPVLSGQIDEPAGDVNGDGVTDLLGRCPHFPPVEDVVVVLSPFGAAIDPCLGLPLQSETLPRPFAVGDLDGDGLSDLVRPLGGVAGGVEIWYGADLMAP